MPDPVELDLLAFRRIRGNAPGRDDFASLVRTELNGGKASREDIDGLADRPAVRYLRISGLEQKTLEHLARVHGARLRGLELWKCPKVESLQPLEAMPELRLVSIFTNRRSTGLWNLARTPHLTALRFTDFYKLSTLDDLAAGTSLEDLEMGTDVSAKDLVVESLAPLASLVRLQALTLGVQGVVDGRIEPLGSLSSLRRLVFGTAIFTTEQVAWLRAHLPAVADGPLTGLVRSAAPSPPGSRATDTWVVGTGKPRLQAERDAESLAAYRQAFERRVEFFRNHPAAGPGDYRDP